MTVAALKAFATSTLATAQREALQGSLHMPHTDMKVITRLLLTTGYLTTHICQGFRL